MSDDLNSTKWWWRWQRRRERRVELLVIGALSRHGDLSGCAITLLTGIGSGRIYPALFRLERSREVCSYWEIMPSPRRRHYRLAERSRAAQAT